MTSFALRLKELRKIKNVTARTCNFLGMKEKIFLTMSEGNYQCI